MTLQIPNPAYSFTGWVYILYYSVTSETSAGVGSALTDADGASGAAGSTGRGISAGVCVGSGVDTGAGVGSAVATGVGVASGVGVGSGVGSGVATTGIVTSVITTTTDADRSPIFTVTVSVSEPVSLVRSVRAVIVPPLTVT